MSDALGRWATRVPVWAANAVRTTFTVSASLWYGYAPVELHYPDTDTWTPFVLEVTVKLEETLRGRSLRGEYWRLKRGPGRGKFAAVIGQFQERFAEAEVTRAFPVVPILETYFRVSGMLPSTPNESPDRIHIQSTTKRRLGTVDAPLPPGAAQTKGGPDDGGPGSAPQTAAGR